MSGEAKQGQRVIFLDFDGVLVTARSLKQRSARHAVAEKSCIEALNGLVERTGASVVISSTWRFCGLQEIKAILDFWGFRGRVQGMTPDLTRVEGTAYSAVSRGLEIAAYLEENPAESFVIIDDDSDMAHLTNRLCKTTFDAGLTEERAQEAQRILEDL